MIVKIATVAPTGRIQISTTASVRDAAGTGAGAAADGGTGGSHTVANRQPVCICNTQCRLQALKNESLDALLKKHGSLDNLLHVDHQHVQKSDAGYRLEKSYHEINGEIYEITRKVPIDLPPPSIEKSDGQQKLSRKKSLPKQYSHPHLAIRKSESLDKPQPPPRISSARRDAGDYGAGGSSSSSRQPKSSQLPQRQKSDADDYFDRQQRQRLSSRSVGAAVSMEHDSYMESMQKDGTHHQRHSSGPSDLTVNRTDISEWLLKLPHKRGESKAPPSQASQQQQPPQKSTEIQLTKSMKDELIQYLKRPLQKQNSGASEFSTLRHDIFEWIKGQDLRKILPSMSKEDKHKVDQGPPPPVPKPRKRHSLGPGEVVAKEKPPPDWIQFPLNRLSPAGRQKLGIAPSSCLDISNKLFTEKPSERSKPDRRLRHSASEVVTPISERTTSKSDRVLRPMTSSSSRSTKEKYQYIYKTLGPNVEHVEKAPRRERSRRHQTQRSATVTDISTESVKQYARKSSSAERALRRSTSSTRPKCTECTDPMCSFIPICANPNCCTYSCYNQSRSLPRYTEPDRCTVHCYEHRCNSLPRCMDSKCLCRPTHSASIVKHHSLPRCTATHRSNSHPASLERGESRSSLPRDSKSKSNGSNGKLIKSASAISLNSRRRRHKTVHFGENLLREVCQNRKLIEPLEKVPTDSETLKPNIQMLYNFVEGVLSAWVDEEDDHIKSGAESEPERGALVRPIHRCNRLRMQTIRRVVTEAAQLRGTLKLGNSRYRHRHWRGTAKECNERFLKKVSLKKN